MKIIITLLLLLTNINIYSQEVNTESYEYEKVSFGQDFNYYGPPFFYHGGLGYQKDDFKMVFPYVGYTFNPIGDYGVDVYTGFSFAYQNIIFHAKAVQQLGTWKEIFELDYLEALNTYGVFSIQYSISGVKMTTSVEVGKTLMTNESSLGIKSGEKVLSIKPSVMISGIALDNVVSRIGYNIDFIFDIIPEKNTHTYHFKTYVPMNFNLAYGWLNLNIMPGFEYKDFINRGSETFLLSGRIEPYKTVKFLSAHQMPNYQFSASVGFELRLYMKFFNTLSPSLSRFFINTFTTIGYASEFHQTPAQGDLLYIYGGGVGYYLFDSASFVFNVGADRSKELFLNISFISPFDVSL